MNLTFPFLPFLLQRRSHFYSKFIYSTLDPAVHLLDCQEDCVFGACATDILNLSLLVAVKDMMMAPLLIHSGGKTTQKRIFSMSCCLRLSINCQATETRCSPGRAVALLSLWRLLDFNVVFPPKARQSVS